MIAVRGFDSPEVHVSARPVLEPVAPGLQAAQPDFDVRAVTAGQILEPQQMAAIREFHQPGSSSGLMLLGLEGARAENHRCRGSCWWGSCCCGSRRCGRRSRGRRCGSRCARGTGRGRQGFVNAATGEDAPWLEQGGPHNHHGKDHHPRNCSKGLMGPDHATQSVHTTQPVDAPRFVHAPRLGFTAGVTGVPLLTGW